MGRVTRIRALAALLVTLALAGPGAAAARAAVPRGWVGVNLTPDLVTRHGSLDRELKLMARAGVQTVRFPLYWSQAQPHRDMAHVPRAQRRRFRTIGGVPTTFAAVDAVVLAAARHRVPLSPVVLAAPAWASDEPARPIPPPRSPADYARFMTALVARYGPHGSFWARHTKLRALPIRSWQIWNEPSNPYYWGPSWTSAYPPLLRAAYDAIKAADPGAGVLMAGLNTGGSAGGTPFTSWAALDSIYAQLDAQGLGRPFDLTAVQIYTSKVHDALRVVRQTRKVMRAHGDAARGIRVTELDWPASDGHLVDVHGRPVHFFAATNDRGQAKRLVAGMKLLARNRRALRIQGVDWFQWASQYNGIRDPFRYSGLRRANHGRIVDTPSMAAFRSVAAQLEGR
jgi:hypothetical protein